MCRVLRVAVSAYYAFIQRPPSPHSLIDAKLKAQIEDVFHGFRGRYGSPRIYRELRKQGVLCSEKRVARLMRELELAASRPRRFVVTTDSKHGRPVAPNHLDRKYQVEAITGLNQAWAGDITYIPTAAGWLYLAVVLDLKSRRVIGWSMADNMESQLVQDALHLATKQRLLRGEKPGLLFHSDRGSQYASHSFQSQLAELKARASMSGKGNCWDNAPIESFFATLKKELVYREKFLTHEQARASLFEYIEVFYNRQRAHSTLGYRSPVEFEQHILN
jgi:transposase InsO family protein